VPYIGIPFWGEEYPVLWRSELMEEKNEEEFSSLRFQIGTSNERQGGRRYLPYIDTNDKRVNDIVIALNNLINKPKPTKRIGFGVN
jgi:hypothetical protein